VRSDHRAEQPSRIGRYERSREQQQVERIQLDRHVIGHVEDEDIGRRGERHESAGQHRSWDEQQDRAEQFGRAGE
jgi:hypothetical protein